MFGAIDMGAEELEESCEEGDDDDDEDMDASDTVVADDAAAGAAASRPAAGFTSGAAATESNTSEPIPIKRVRTRESEAAVDLGEVCGCCSWRSKAILSSIFSFQSFQSCSYPGSCACSHQQQQQQQPHHQQRSFSSSSKRSHSLEKARSSRTKSFDSSDDSTAQHCKRARLARCAFQHATS